MDSFAKSVGQQQVAYKYGTKFVLGSFGKEHFGVKTAEAKADRFPESELGATLDNIKAVYRGSSDPTTHRFETAAWVSQMPDEQIRIIYTKLNRFGDEEITGWHVWNQKANPNYLKTLESFGAPTESRTRILSIEGSGSSPLTYGGKSSIPKVPEKSMKEVAESLKGPRPSFALAAKESPAVLPDVQQLIKAAPYERVTNKEVLEAGRRTV